MKLYCVTDSDCVDYYYTRLRDAKAQFKRCIEKPQAFSTANVELTERIIEVNSDTVLRLLNGDGGYLVKTTTLQEWELTD